MPLAFSSYAANFTTSVTQAAGQNWNVAIWVPDGGGTAVAPTAGNTYTIVSNGITIINNSANARIRNPTTTGVQTFPGDSLAVNTNAEIRFKAGPSAVNFPGVGGNPGLIMNGGFLNLADPGVFTVAGQVQVGSVMYVDASNNNGPAPDTTRGLNLTAQLSGSGTVAFLQSATNTPYTIANSNNVNTFFGNWIVTSGRLLGSISGSLGTNSSFTIDPLAPLGLDPALVIAQGPAVLEVNYDLNSAGLLTLTNGGMMALHQNCYFSAANIEGTPLSPGSHSYSELEASFPANFLPGGAGSITIRPYSTNLLSFTPVINPQPASVALYANGTATFSVGVSGDGPITNQWFHDNMPLNDGGNISGATSLTLIISNVSSADTGNYTFVASNLNGASTSSNAVLTVPLPPSAYAAAVLSNGPVAYWELDDLSDPATNGPAYDFVGGYTGTYGVNTENTLDGIPGPRPTDGFPGMAANNGADLGFHGLDNSAVTAPALNLNTNTVTLCAWVQPLGSQAQFNALVFCRGGGTVAGVRYGSGLDAQGNRTLGYTWNDESGAATWNSELVPPLNIWSFVTLVVTPTNATIYMINANGFASATHNYPHVIQSFASSTLIGYDAAASGGRTLNGIVDEVSVFNRALSKREVVDMYSAASGVAVFPPSITTDLPSTLVGYLGQTFSLGIGADGTTPLYYQWQVGTNNVNVNLTDGSQFSGTTNSILTISNLDYLNAADYIVVISNAYGSVTSSIASLTVNPTNPPMNITMDGQQPNQNPPVDWDTSGWWSDGQPASVSAVSNPGSTYEILSNGRLRTPVNSSATFPGDSLTIDGDGTWELANGPDMGQLDFKGPAFYNTVYFKKMIMDGGQLLQAGNNPSVMDITGEMDVITNTPIFEDQGNDRGFRIDALLTGSGTIEYHNDATTFNPSLTNGLNIAGSANTFSGQWNVVNGTLLGSGVGSLGTNSVTIGVNGAFEPGYDLTSPNATLVLNGRMYLHQNVTFKNVTVVGIPLADGIYTHAQLSSSFPTNFPTSWAQQNGSSVSTASGTLNVGNMPVPVILKIQPAGAGQIQLTWPNGILLEANDVRGPWITNMASSPFTFMPTQTNQFYRILVQ